MADTASMKKISDIAEIKPGRYMIIDGEACLVEQIDHSKTGKHGAAKFRIVARAVLSNKKKDVIKASGSKVEVPIIEKGEASVLTIVKHVEQQGANKIETRTANVMDSVTYETFDIIIPEELWNNITEGVEIIYWNVLGTKIMKQLK